MNEKCIVEDIKYDKEKKELIYKNDCKFINVPLSVYEFSIGNYQVIKNYLRVRKGRELSINEIEHCEVVMRVVDYTLAIQEQIDVIIYD
ncbi:type ISP restriction/modification enzyme [Borrelia miyamotoi]|uniref:type ISP restriction/modification enzyme n=1 Tax=Borrelia miyamotoi TaxID=47466 RepID=UPI00397781B8